MGSSQTLAGMRLDGAAMGGRYADHEGSPHGLAPGAICRGAGGGKLTNCHVCWMDRAADPFWRSGSAWQNCTEKPPYKLPFLWISVSYRRCMLALRLSANSLSMNLTAYPLRQLN